MELTRHFVEKPWGRTDISGAFGAPTGQRIGEIWYEPQDNAALPLLVKWLFTSEKLSIQVHPSDAQANARGMPSGKEECWYVVDAEPDARIGIGTLRPLDPQELRSASLSGEIEALMDWKPVQAGSYFYIPAGTVHAIGAGVTLVEVQQYADITYRLYDYGRLDKGVARELHLDDGVAVSKAEPYADLWSGIAHGNAKLASSQFFDLWLVENENGLADVPDHRMRWVVPLNGRSTGSCKLLRPGDPLSFEDRMLVAAA